MFDKELSKFFNQLKSIMITFLIIFFIILLGRSNSYLLGFETLNIDESQMMANAVRFHQNGYNVFEFDGTSSGFLNSIILNWPNLFSGDVTFLSTRITAIVLISLIFYFCFLYFKTEVNKKTSLLLIMPGLLLFALTNDPDFVHYSSELLSTSFLIICLYGFNLYLKRNRTDLFYVGMFLLGLTLFSKIQIVTTATMLAFSISLYNFFKRNYKIFFYGVVIFLTPIFLVLIVFTLKGNIHDFYLNYFEFPKAVVSNYSLGENLKNENSLSSATHSNINIKNYFLYNSVFHYFYFQIILSLFLIFLLIKFKKLNDILNANLLFITISILMIAISILITGAVYRHYFIPLIPLSTLFVGLIFIKNKNFVINNYFSKIFICLILTLFISTFIFEDKKFYAKRFEKTKFKLNDINFKSPKILDYLLIEQGKILIWGWNPQLYVLSYFYPSDRATISQKYIEDYSNKKYFNDRLLHDIKKNKPNVIYDFVKPKSFYYSSESQSLKNSPIIELLEKDYNKFKSLNDNCPDLYLDKLNYDQLKKKLINFNFSDERLQKLDNFSVTKNICDDSVIFDNSFQDSIAFKFKVRSQIDKLLILASHLNKDEVEIDIQLKEQNNAYKKRVILKKYPFWTIITLNKKNIDTVIFDISSLKKLNYGINELKFYKNF